MTATQDFDEIEAIKALIQNFFHAINASDTHALQTLFAPTANLTMMRQKPARPDPAASLVSAPTASDEEPGSITRVFSTTIEVFIAMIEEGERKRKRAGAPAGPKLHEWPLLEETHVKVDGLFGMAWSPFRVTFDGVLHHYGQFVYTMGKVGVEGGSRKWRVEALTQSYRSTPGWESKV